MILTYYLLFVSCYLLLAICYFIYDDFYLKLAITCKNLFPFAPVVCLVIYLMEVAPKSTNNREFDSKWPVNTQIWPKKAKKWPKMLNFQNYLHGSTFFQKEVLWVL